MPRFLLTGAKQRVRSFSRRGNLGEQARLAELDTDTGEVTLRFGYHTPPELCAEVDPTHTFKSASWDAGLLAVVTPTEVLHIDVTQFRLERHYSHPWFNDLHHVARLRGKLHVACTGLDALLVLEPSGEVAMRSALEDDSATPLDPQIDYRRIGAQVSRCHPNFVCETPAGIWITRFRLRDAVCLDRPGLRVPIEVGGPHDGVISDGGLWFTTVDGHVVEADAATGAIKQCLDLNSIEGTGELLGWCRGFCLHEGVIYVGFTRIRYTRFRQNLSWLKNRGAAAARYRTLPTRVVAYDLRGRRKLHQWVTEDAGLDTLFSILPIRTAASGETVPA